MGAQLLITVVLVVAAACDPTVRAEGDVTLAQKRASTCQNRKYYSVNHAPPSLAHSRWSSRGWGCREPR